MSNDCCKKCGVREPIPYRQIRKICELPDCPQKIQKERMDKFLANIPIHEPQFKKS